MVKVSSDPKRLITPPTPIWCSLPPSESSTVSVITYPWPHSDLLNQNDVFSVEKVSKNCCLLWNDDNTELFAQCFLFQKQKITNWAVNRKVTCPPPYLRAEPFPSSAMLPNWGAHRLPVSYSAPVPLRHLRETPPQQSKVFLSHDDRRLCIFSLTRLMRRNMGDTTPSPSALHPALRMPMLLIFRQPARNVIKCNLFMVKFITGIAFLDPQFNNEWAST